MYLDNVRRFKETQVKLQPTKPDNRPSPLLVDLLAKERVDVQTESTKFAERMAREREQREQEQQQQIAAGA